MQEYNPKEIEKRWQEKWEKEKLHLTPDSVEGKDNEYVLVEFAYPSGNLHVGHWYAFSVPDMYARYRRMLGKNVLFPMGFDAFGLPAENAAIKNNLNPREWTFSNIDYMRNQLHSMGASFDWSREVITASPEYYKWTQWLFLKFFEKGLAYQSETPVNWCPGCKTVLANEQVVAGECERCGSTVEKRNMLQWNLKITEYADRLIDDIESLDWPKPIKDAQKNWIGRSEGAEIEFGIKNYELRIKVFTTRPDTIFGATYLVLAPEHKLVEELKSQILNWDEIKNYVEITKNKKDIDRSAEGKEKTGVELKGLKAINPATKEEIPIWIADYVLPHYGTGAIMAVPADDKRDEEFAQKFNLPIIKNYKVAGFEDFGTKKTTFKLRDWIISRQRYWGCPIPIIHCEKCGAVTVPEKDLPVVLPEVEDYLPSDDGKSPLSKVSAWVNVKCPKCGENAKRETDTLDTFIDSSWYFMRYADPKNEKEFASKEKLKQWMPVNFYSGGAEHTNMHLLYSRFFHKVLFDLGLVGENEPYLRRMNRGLILGPDGQKMSKSKGNVVDPDDYVERLGADTVRAYLAFIGPYNEVGSYPWNPDSIVGIRRFLERVWNVAQTKVGTGSMDEKLVHQSIKNITESLERMKMNTAVPVLMTFINTAEKSGLTLEQFEIYLKLLAPFAPHISEELWQTLGHIKSIHLEPWPKFDAEKLMSGEVTMGVQVNGKHRANITVSTEVSEEEVKEKVLELPEVKKWLNGATPKRIIVVLAKIVNVVV
ncbi:MAG: leucine--tRNA ligase [Minisyncoccota bacterium]